jgi:hypothetical protein
VYWEPGLVNSVFHQLFPWFSAGGEAFDQELG